MRRPMTGPGWFLEQLVAAALGNEPISDALALRVLVDPSLELEPLLHAAFRVRERHFGRKVWVHVIENAQNGYCSEDCAYCAQSTSSRAAITPFQFKSDEEILEGAQRARGAGAYRYCVVLSGRGPGPERVARLAELVRRIKTAVPIEVCLSAGFIDRDQARVLRQAGLDRYNHNLNTSSGYYGRICTSHDYHARVATLEAARAAGIEVCSGLIIGMGEQPEDLVEVARTLRRLDVRSIPVNFYVHIPGSALGEQRPLSPEACLRALCLFRFVNPDAEIRAAGGREACLGADDPRCLLPANSLFCNGYLNTGGASAAAVLQMIEAAGFEAEQVDG